MHRLYGLADAQLRQETKLEAVMADTTLADYVTDAIREKNQRERIRRIESERIGAHGTQIDMDALADPTLAERVR